MALEKSVTNENTFEFNFNHESILEIREVGSTILQFNHLEIINHRSLTYDCPVTGSMYFYVEGKCFFVDTDLRTYDEAKENCKNRFGKQLLGRLFEPKTIEVNNNVAQATYDITGEYAFWIGIKVAPGSKIFYYDSWGALPFSNWGGGQQHDCVQWYWSGYWNTLRCSKLNKSICELI